MINHRPVTIKDMSKNLNQITKGKVRNFEHEAFNGRRPKANHTSALSNKHTQSMFEREENCSSLAVPKRTLATSRCDKFGSVAQDPTPNDECTNDLKSNHSYQNNNLQWSG